MKQISISISYASFPKLLILAGLYHLVFIFLGVNYLYLIMYILGIFWALTKHFSRFTIEDIGYVFFLLYLVVNSLVNSLLHQESATIIFFASMQYFLPLCFWFLYYKTTRQFNIYNLILSLRWHVFLISLLAIVQYYFSPNLFGLLSIKSDNILWAQESNNYFSFFRATSILFSPQVFGAFCGLYIISYVFSVKQNNKKKNILDYLLLIIIFIGGIHSGNKSLFAILFIYLMYLLFNNKKKILPILLLLFSFIFLLIRYSEELFVVQRIFFNENILLEEQEGRLSIWKDTIKNISFLGDGAGSWSSSSLNETSQVVESYILQLLSEFGFIFLIFYLFVLINNYFKIRKTNVLFPFLLCIFIQIIVHIFNSPAFIMYWGILLYGININEQPRDKPRGVQQEFLVSSPEYRGIKST